MVNTQASQSVRERRTVEASFEASRQVVRSRITTFGRRYDTRAGSSVYACFWRLDRGSSDKVGYSHHVLVEPAVLGRVLRGRGDWLPL